MVTGRFTIFVASQRVGDLPSCSNGNHAARPLRSTTGGPTRPVAGLGIGRQCGCLRLREHDGTRGAEVCAAAQRDLPRATSGLLRPCRTNVGLRTPAGEATERQETAGFVVAVSVLTISVRLPTFISVCATHSEGINR